MSKSQKNNPNMNNDSNSEDLTIFVGGLASGCTSKDLFFYFKKFGAILSCEPQTWTKGGKKCRGFGLVRCGDLHTHKKILSQKRHVFQRRVIECKRWFSSKEKLQKYNEELKLRKVFVGGIPLRFTSDDLEDLFKKEVGGVDIAYVIKEHKTGKSKGFGYVVFERIEDRNTALERRHFKVGKKKIVVSKYCKKTENEENQENTFGKDPIRNQSNNSDSTNSSQTSTAENSPLKSNLRNLKKIKKVKNPQSKEERKKFEFKLNSDHAGEQKKEGGGYSLFGEIKNKDLFRKFLSK